MTRVLRESTLRTLGLGTALDVFKRGGLPASAADLVDQVFGPAGERGSLLLSGASGIVGAGKTVQLGSRLEPYGVPIVALDFPGAPDGIGQQYPGLVAAFGKETSARILSSVIRFTYDGVHLPPGLSAFRPRFALEAVPEVLEIKKAHYEILRAAFEGIEIRSVTSGFPSSQLGVGVAHPAFPHNINKVWEVVEEESANGTTSSAITQLFWALGLMPMPVADRWSFVLDVLFCGLTLAATRYHEASGMPFWRVDKLVRKLLGPNPFRAHDAIGTKGATFLTWTCLRHLSEHYGALFAPSPIIAERADTGQTWYPPNHFRPLVQWTLDGDEEDELRTRMLGPLFQMTALMLHEQRAHLSYINSIGELCAQLAPGVLARIRDCGAEAAIQAVEAYHRLDPQAATGAWHPDAFDRIETPEWQQLYVNAEHDGTAGVITIGRESYSWDVDAELGRAIDWLRAEGIERVILSGDFHIARQLVGADTRDFFPGLDDAGQGTAVSRAWSQTARRLGTDFAVSVAFLGGKRCLGGMLELALHCHYVVASEGTRLGFPEVTLPVVPGMEGCHLPFRRTGADGWPKLLSLLLEGKPVRASEAVSWLIDYAGPLEDALAATWAIASGGHGVTKRPLEEGSLAAVTDQLPALAPAGSPGAEAARQAITDTVRDACGRTFSEALEVQARRSGDFIAGEHCRRGAVGTAFAKTMKV